MQRGKTFAIAALAGLLLLGGCAAKAIPQRQEVQIGGASGDTRHPPVLAAAVDPAPGEELAALAPQTGAPEEVVTASYTGIASWYGRRFHGRLTASGEPFDMAAMTAAHRNLPFGSRVRVTNLANGRAVVVTINDRGPNVHGRLIDLSRAAAEKIGILDGGLARVRLEVLANENS